MTDFNHPRTGQQPGRTLSHVMIILSLGLLLISCPRDPEDKIMYKIYHQWHPKIMDAVSGTDISAAYMAALISLESSPPGNARSERFEQHIYERLYNLKHQAQKFGSIKQSDLARYDDAGMRQLATSYGLTQIMGYHCIRMGCTIDELRGEDHLLWAIGYMMNHYQKAAAQKDWQAAFRIHNTGRPDGRPHRADYVERGLLRMEYYQAWIDTRGELF